MAKLMVAGAGSWGTALAVLMAEAGRETVLWCRDKERALQMATARENARYLGGVAFPEALSVTSVASDLKDAEGLLFVVPAQAARGWLERFREATSGADLPVALCCKGLERGSMAPMHKVLSETWPEAKGSVLSGPSFAADVARGLPTAVTLASEDEAQRSFWLERLSTPTFRPYASDDPLGAELGGAVKNVLAIACGIAVGKGFGESAKAALIARGFAELQRFGLAMGAKPETLAGLSGLGDLVLTCNSPQSRNFSLGMAIGEGADPATYLESQKSVAEGAATAGPLTEQARALGCEMPISEGVAAVIDGRQGVDEAIGGLMNRPLRSEA
ncbi:NAD(P)-dependent glycerol-3-phosphate dehydrogenase [Parvularcula sp. ZS-1/3]|uniref:Glycerol-3-phosphate dehydrogenase [NAD(P)+] n=1 Tax=Parvularcula mediterranea TaxID=2732508 RepID=A0A7Y3W533_9PROT|nr:NAD(P)H-dependent glycerol-3-phosphate dehydrogenase [Parvularcula mediterranea]NNU16103.1 NAD(P)-dependent glycerol-3-phosphate dehydrogenase [Parvularcula mediterranea]